jgi:hypothetical protein
MRHSLHRRFAVVTHPADGNLCFAATIARNDVLAASQKIIFSSIMSGLVSFPDMQNAVASLALLSIANSGQMVLKLREGGGAGFDLRQSADAENQIDLIWGNVHERACPSHEIC